MSRAAADRGRGALPPGPSGEPPADPEEAVRVRLGADTQTAPAVLIALASDEAVLVRAAVAMNPAAPMLASSVLARDEDERVRTLLARKLANLVPDLPVAERDRLRSHVLATLAGLVEDEAERVRAAITDVLKDMPHAPRSLILRLACDQAFAVSEPVIRLSPLLTQEDLLALVAAPPNAFAVAAVACRADLAENVADAIAATADTGAITALLENPTAAIREATLDALVARASEHLEWQRPLVHRPALSERVVRALSEIVTTQLLDELASRVDLPAPVGEELRHRLADRLYPAALPGTDADLVDAVAKAERLLAEDQLNEEALLGAVRRGETRTATAMLAVAADVPPSVVDRAATLRSPKGLVSLVWKAGFSMRVAPSVQMLLARLSPAAVLRATTGGGFPLAIEEMRWQLDFLGRMGR